MKPGPLIRGLAPTLNNPSAGTAVYLGEDSSGIIHIVVLAKTHPGGNQVTYIKRDIVPCRLPRME